MTLDELHKWSEDFKSIVYWKGQVASRNNDIILLSRYDKNDSHKEAILRAISYRDEAKKIYKERLRGYEFEYIMASVRQAKLMLRYARERKSKQQEWNDKFKNFNPFNN